MIRLLFLLLFTIPSVAQTQKLKISDDHRFLVREDGSPFVWIGETNWFFAQLPPATIDRILDTRSAQGFTVMSISCRQDLYNGRGGPGRLDSLNEAWWAYLDEYVAKCAQRNMYVGLTLGWWGLATDHSAAELYDYGRWVGHRYRNDNNIVWLTLGEAGSYSRKDTLASDKLAALVRGIREGDTGDKLLTVHADYRRGTSLTDDTALCDFNNWQTSQWCCRDDLPKNDDRRWTVWEAIAYDYQQSYDGTPKPTLDAEAWYENNRDFCGATPFHIRRRAYFTIFAGAFGHTYGAGGIWDGLTEPDSCSRTALGALSYPGAADIGRLSRLLHSLDDGFLMLRPDQSLIVGENPDSYDTHRQATVAHDSSFALVYSASDTPYTIDLTKLSDSLLFVWHNPRADEQAYDIMAVSDSERTHSFDPPGETGAGNDWVLMVGTRRFLKEFSLN